MKYFKERKHLKSLQKPEAYLEPKQASTMELFVNILNDLLFSQQKLHHRCYLNFQSQAKVEQIIAIDTTCSVPCYFYFGMMISCKITF